jgi:hypothetical protein
MITEALETRTCPPYPTRFILGVNQGLSGEKLTTNRRRYGTFKIMSAAVYFGRYVQ